MVLAHQVLLCIISVEDPEPIYRDNRHKTNQKCFHSNMKHFYLRLNSRCSYMKDMIHRNVNCRHHKFFSCVVIKNYRNQVQKL